MNTDTMRLISMIIPGSVFLSCLLLATMKYVRREIAGKRRAVYVIAAGLIYVLVTVVRLAVNTSYVSVLSEVAYDAFLSSCIFNALTDCAEKRIYTVSVLFCAVLKIPGLISDCISGGGTDILLSTVPGVFVCGGILLSARLFSKNGIGTGDILMFASAGFVLGLLPSVRVMIYSLLLSSIIGGILLASGKVKLRDELPMAPFLLFGYIAECII